MNPIFKNISAQETETFLNNIKAKTLTYKKDSFIFFEGDTPACIFVLQSGAVQIEKNTTDGKRLIMNRFDMAGTVFAEVYALLDSAVYDYSCRVISDANILCLPIAGIFAAGVYSETHFKVLKNLLTVLAHKAYFLNQKLLIFSSFSLRQKIALYLLQKAEGSSRVELSLNREAMSEYLAVPRPSLSRELMSMQKDGLLKIEKDTITVNLEKLEDFS
ncbi:MAG: Crp/Fnr family transcriptional regulator [Treponema sp.]